MENINLRHGDKVLVKNRKDWIEGIYIGPIRFPGQGENEAIVAIKSWTGKPMNCAFPRDKIKGALR
jgi:hypothetical protein